MFDPPTHRAVVSFDVTRDHVEAYACRTPAVFCQPRACGALYARALSSIDGLGGTSVACTATRLHLDEHDEATPPDDQVDLDAAAANVAVFDAITSPREIGGRAAFAFDTELATRIAGGLCRFACASSSSSVIIVIIERCPKAVLRVVVHSGIPRDRGRAA